MGKRAAEENEEEAAAAALAAKKAAKKAKKAAAAAAAEEEEEEDPEAAALAAKKAKKAAKKAAAAAAAAEEEEEEDPEAAALAAKKAAKKAKKAAAAAAAAEEEEEDEPAKKAPKKEEPAAADGADADYTVFVRGLPFATTEEALNKDFAECGEILSCRMPLNDEGSCRGIAFIKYTDKASMDKALAFNETDYGGRTIYCAPAGEGKGKGKDGSKGKGKSGGGNENTVFVRGLPFATTEEALNKDFGECGEILSCRMPLNDEGSCKGIAFIKFADKESFDKAIAFNETDYGGRTIFCVAAGDKPEGKGKGKDGDKGKGKGKKGKKGKAPSESFAKSTGAMVESTGVKQTFADSDEE